MSYILEALKKAEIARNRGKAPELFAVQATQTSPAERGNQWTYIVIAVIAVNAAVLLTWLRPWQRHAPMVPSQIASATIDRHPAPEKAAPAATPAPAETAAEPLMVEPAVQSPAAPGPVESKAPAPVLRSTPPSGKTIDSPKPSEAKTSPKAPGSSALRESAKAGSSAKMAAQSPPDSPAPATPGATEANESGVIAFNELPPSIRQELGSMTVAVHMYSAKPADRFVSINDRPLREGDEINPGLMLERITYDGMILSYKGYRFRKGIN